ncbi:MAG: aminoacyl-tRNA hydrolase [Thiotrichales bacterium]|jgi:PTH1 family peptidyl-tRNA hydrolase|nr:aminoacyl-tRNA hydrolase [Thiotrichales bacterium]
MVPQLIVGLGNPGKEYETTRHNAGFFFVDALAEVWKTHFSLQTKFFGQVAKANVHGVEVWLLKPTTFMNRSGMAVAALANFYKISPQAILAIHDELDIQPGEARLKVGGGAGGHNGLKDMIKALGTQEFMRLRLGIGHPGHASQVANYVLHPCAKQERDAIDNAIARSLHVMDLLMDDKMPLAMNKLHTKG